MIVVLPVGVLTLCRLLQCEHARELARIAAGCDSQGAYSNGAHFWTAALEAERNYRNHNRGNQAP